MNRPEYFHIYKDGDFDWRKKAEIIIAKHRNGAIGDVRLAFRGEFARFRNLDDEWLVVAPVGDAPMVRSSRLNAAPPMPEEPGAPLPPLPDYITDGAPVSQMDILPPKPTDEMPF